MMRTHSGDVLVVARTQITYTAEPGLHDQTTAPTRAIENHH